MGLGALPPPRLPPPNRAVSVVAGPGLRWGEAGGNGGAGGRFAYPIPPAVPALGGAEAAVTGSEGVWAVMEEGVKNSSGIL